MNKILLHCLVCVVLLPIASAAGEDPPDGIPDGGGRYEDLVALFDEFDEWRRADVRYDRAVVAVRQKEIAEFRDRLADMAVAEWERAQQIDWLAVRSRLDEAEFMLRVSRPWFRDPGFYTDRMLRVTFTELPVEGDQLGGMARPRARIDVADPAPLAGGGCVADGPAAASSRPWPAAS